MTFPKFDLSLPCLQLTVAQRSQRPTEDGHVALGHGLIQGLGYSCELVLRVCHGLVWTGLVLSGLVWSLSLSLSLSGLV